MLALYWLALVCTLQSLLSSVYRPAGAVYSEVMLSICWLSISLLVILHSVERAIVRLSPCRSCLFRSIAIDMLALYIPAGDIALCRACYRWAVALLGASIQLYCYRPASSLLASVGLHSAERAIVSLSPCWVRLFRCIAIDMLALYWLALVCTLQSLLSSVYRPAGAVYSEVMLSICWLSISLLVILHSVERAIVSLSPCWVRLFRSIAIDMLALY